MTKEPASSRYNIGADQAIASRANGLPDDSPRTSAVVSDWSEVNRQLRHHGFHAVMVLPRLQIEEVPSGAVILEEHTSHHLRQTLESLMSDCDRRQALVQELISASNRLQKENKEHAEANYNYEAEIRELENQLETEQIKVQEMENCRMSELHRHGEEVNDLQLTKDEVVTLYKQMEQKLAKKEEEITQVQKRYQELVYKEEERLERQTKMFHHLKKRSPQKQNAMDERVLDIVDSYEEQLDEIKEELDLLKRENKALTASYIGTHGDVNNDEQAMSEEVSVVSEETSEEGRVSADRSPRNRQRSRSPVDGGPRSGSGGKWRSDRPRSPGQSPRRMKEMVDKILFCEKQLRNAKKLIRLLENENTHLKMDLQARPATDEWKKTKKYNKKLEKLLAQNNLSPPSKPSTRHTDRHHDHATEAKRYSTNVGNIEFLPIDVCRDYLKEVCSRLEVNDLQEIADRLDSIDVMAEAYPAMEKLISDVMAVTQEKGAPKVSDEDMSASIDTHAAYCQRAWQNILPTLRIWLRELKQIKDLQAAINQLAVSLMPWKPESMFRNDDRKPLKMRELRSRVESLANQDRRPRPSELKGEEKPSMEQLQSIVAHFQKLFDVTCLSGVFPRMNELYMRIGEVYNSMNTMRELLNLDPSCKAADVVNAVGKLSKARHLLKVDDLSGLIQRLEEYDEFFPAFQEMVTELCRVLAVDKMDEIVTAVRALIKFPHY